MQKILISRSTLEQLYLKQGLTTVEIARRLGVSQSAVSRRLSEHGIATRTMADYHRVDIPADKLRQLYWDQNLSPDEIAVFYHCSPETILHRIHDAGVSLKPTGWQQMRRYVPDSVLNAWPSPELSYVVGLVASDGNLRGAGNSVSLTSVDRELVEIYLRLLQVHGARIALHHTSHKDQYTVAFSDPVYRAF